MWGNPGATPTSVHPAHRGRASPWRPYHHKPYLGAYLVTCLLCTQNIIRERKKYQERNNEQSDTGTEVQYGGQTSNSQSTVTPICQRIITPGWQLFLVYPLGMTDKPLKQWKQNMFPNGLSWYLSTSLAKLLSILIGAQLGNHHGMRPRTRYPNRQRGRCWCIGREGKACLPLWTENREDDTVPEWTSLLKR